MVIDGLTPPPAVSLVPLLKPGTPLSVSGRGCVCVCVCVFTCVCAGALVIAISSFRFWLGFFLPWRFCLGGFCWCHMALYVTVTPECWEMMKLLPGTKEQQKKDKLHLLHDFRMAATRGQDMF